MRLGAFLRPLKNKLFGPGLRPHRIRFGIARGLLMQIDPAAKTQRILGLDEREIQREFVNASRWADVLVDVGSSDGYYGLIFHKYNPRGTVHLIDGNPDFAPQQRAHFAANFPKARPECYTRFVTPPDRQGPGTMLLSRDLPIRGRRVFFKIDVDGWELDVLKSAEALLADTACRFLIETHSPALERDCIAFLTGHGFETRLIPNAWWRVFVPENRPPHNRWLAAVRS
jgi:hypothetical protein